MSVESASRWSTYRPVLLHTAIAGCVICLLIKETVEIDTINIYFITARVICSHFTCLIDIVLLLYIDYKAICLSASAISIMDSGEKTRTIEEIKLKAVQIIASKSNANLIIELIDLLDVSSLFVKLFEYLYLHYELYI